MRPSVALVHHAKAVGWRNEMPFGRDTRVIPSNTTQYTSDRGPGPPREWENWGLEPPVKIFIANCGRTLADRGMVTIDTL